MCVVAKLRVFFFSVLSKLCVFFPFSTFSTQKQQARRARNSVFVNQERKVTQCHYHLNTQNLVHLVSHFPVTSHQTFVTFIFFVCFVINSRNTGQMLCFCLFCLLLFINKHSTLYPSPPSLSPSSTCFYVLFLQRWFHTTTCVPTCVRFGLLVYISFFCFVFVCLCVCTLYHSKGSLIFLCSNTIIRAGAIKAVCYFCLVDFSEFQK